MKTFDYIQDGGHGWVKVPLSLLLDLGIHSQISTYSYLRKSFAYLEEDCDLARFFDAFNARFGTDPQLRSRIAREKQSKVRGYDRYTLHNVNVLLNNN
jgi:hypothetical protein